MIDDQAFRHLIQRRQHRHRDGHLQTVRLDSHSAVDGYSRLTYTDNGSCCKAHDFTKVLRGASHQRIRPYMPLHNGKIERYQQILSEEFLYARCWTSEAVTH